MADRGLRRIAALMGLGRIADYMSGTLQCRDASLELNQKKLPRPTSTRSEGHLEFDRPSVRGHWHAAAR
eukprot:13332786-Alexandrium_andersonii.AAC.1